MARIQQGEFSGQSSSNEENNEIIHVNGQETIEVPDTAFISNAAMERDGQDLVLQNQDGETLTIDGYFAASPAPTIESPDGAVLTPNLVNSFLSTAAQYAQASTMTDESPVGAVEEVKGDATVVRSDGTSETITLGTPIYEGDVIETSAEGAVNIVFLDETSMAVSQNARMAVDDYEFDPSTESGETNLSVLRGVFVFTSGLIGRDDPDDVMIDTPVGSIGIRGTIIAGNINPGGESEITVVEGAIVVTNGFMEKTLSQQFETVKITGFNDNMQEMGVKEAGDVNDSYGSVSDVVPKLFSSINDAEKENSNGNDTQIEAREEAAAEEQAAQDAEQKQEQQQEEQKADDPAQDQTPDQTLEMGLDPSMPADEGRYQGENNRGEAETNGNNREYERGVLDNDDKRSAADDLYYNYGQKSEYNAPFRFVSYKLYENSDPGYIVAKLYVNNLALGATFSFSDTGTATSASSNFIIDSSDPNVILVKVNAGASIATGDVSTQLEPFTLVASWGGKTLDWSHNTEVNDSFLDLESGARNGLHNTRVAGTAPQDVVRGDFDGDGDKDVAYIDNADNVQIADTFGDTPYTSYNSTAFSSIASIGDYDNNGTDDLIYGTQGSPTGSVYISGGPFLQTGLTAGDNYGQSVAGIGDIDGDGQLDFAVTAPGTNAGDGRVYVYHDGASQSHILNGATGTGLGKTVAGLGDVSGDGLSDFIVTNEQDQAFIYTGATPTVSSTISYTSGTLVSAIGAGDINGDGFDDVAVTFETSGDVNTYVIFGGTSMQSTYTALDLEDSDIALKIHHDGGDSSNYTVKALGDVNGDGFDDLLVGDDDNYYTVYGAINDVGGTTPYATDGSATDGNGSAGELSPVDSNPKSLVGDVDFNDNGETGLSMRGGGSNNTFEISNAGFINIDGGKGTDTIVANAASLDFSALEFEQISQIEKIQIGEGNQITLTLENIFNLLKTSDNGVLHISGTVGGTNEILNIDATSTGAGSSTNVETALQEVAANADYSGDVSGHMHFDIGGYDLYIDNTNVTVNVV